MSHQYIVLFHCFTSIPDKSRIIHAPPLLLPKEAKETVCIDRRKAFCAFRVITCPHSPAFPHAAEDDRASVPSI
jgi:hypothetical protein